MIFSLIKRIRHKPKGTRDTIALSIAGVFTFVIAGIWILRVPGQMMAPASKQTDESNAFSTLFSGVGEQFSALQASLASINASSSVQDGADQMIVDQTLLQDEIKYLSGAEDTTTQEASTTSVRTIDPVTYGQVVWIATTTPSATTSSSSVLY